MPDRDLPQGTASSEPLTFDEGTAALEDILSPPEREPAEDQVQNRDEEEPEGEAESDAETDDDEPGEADQEADEEADDDAESIEVDDSFEVELEDGKKATLADLKEAYLKAEKRVTDFQRDYTQKTTALSSERKEVEEQGKRVLDHAQQLKQQRELILNYAQAFMPQPPERPNVPAEADPVAWSIYSQQKDEYDRQVQQFQQMQSQHQQELQRQAEQQKREFAQYVDQERQKLLEARPELKDPKRLEEVRAGMSVFAEHYGFTPQETESIADSRMLRAMLDLIEYHKIRNAAPKAKAKLVGKPKMLKSGKTQTAQDKSSRLQKEKADRLRKTGSLEAAVDALLDMDL